MALLISQGLKKLKQHLPIPPQANPSVIVIKAKNSFQRETRVGITWTFLVNKRNKALELRLCLNPFSILLASSPSPQESLLYRWLCFYQFPEQTNNQQGNNNNLTHPPQEANGMLFFFFLAVCGLWSSVVKLHILTSASLGKSLEHIFIKPDLFH